MFTQVTMATPKLPVHVNLSGSNPLTDVFVSLCLCWTQRFVFQASVFQASVCCCGHLSLSYTCSVLNVD